MVETESSDETHPTQRKERARRRRERVGGGRKVKEGFTELIICFNAQTNKRKRGLKTQYKIPQTLAKTSSTLSLSLASFPHWQEHS